MSKEFGKYLDQQLSAEDRDKLNRLDVKESSTVEQVDAPDPVPSNEIDSSEQKLDESTQERIESIQQGEGNNYEAKDSLSAYPVRENDQSKGQGQEKEQEQDNER